jgi:thiol-disulfide isomerase/thioredoxin
MGVWQGGLLQSPENPRLRALAEHLDRSGAKFYGAFWCPVCREQKELFGRAAEHLPYVECSPQGRRGPVALACTDAGVESFPTWVIRGRTHQQLLSIEELERLSFFRWRDGGGG